MPAIADEMDADWQSNFSKFILQPGCLRKCRSCRCVEDEMEDNIELHQCEVCEKTLPRNEYNDSMWKHRDDPSRRTLCLKCCNPPCTSAHCRTCTTCRNPSCRKRECTQPIASLHWKRLPQTKQDVQSFLCDSCMPITCHICQVPKTAEHFIPSMLQNRWSLHQQTRCKDCTRPLCTASLCQTCKRCRDPTCSDRPCRKQFTAPNPKHLPNNLAAVLSYICARCQASLTCTTCGRTDMLANFGEDKKTCLQCCSKQMEAEALETFTCQICTLPKARSENTASMWRNRNATNQRTLCRDCCNPPCIARHCKTCKHCRDPACKRRKCQEEIMALHPKHLPNDLAEVEAFLCDNCRFITCTAKDSRGNICGKMMPKKQQAKLTASARDLYICGECLTCQLSNETLATSQLKNN